ncbi:L-glutaminase [Actinacidiphila yanglinensis]|uniref:Glutaminase n=1 Tax=Actinacidiphila yanglinensis TaxID=310779 RepID=A0A1H6CB60_9ACTN|nr:glutaminase A [Actinacidiphila yanglinensis]SEG70210.1 L-glutaminase [Actinacidiphila yanglinensis]
MIDTGPLDVISAGLAEVHRLLLPLTDGEVASYIPKLALADPQDFGLALVSMDGHRYQAGRSAVRFSIQSVSKPFVYALALAELGLDEMHRWVGNEPSGDAFNAISLERGTGRPANPMINAGAIATTNLVPAGSPEERFARVLDGLGAFAGRRLDVDEEVYLSESASGDRNRALAYLMHAAGSLRTEPRAAVETYFRQCAVRVDTVDLAVMAATLATGGVNPVTGRRVVPEPVAVQVLAVMATCGMYDAAGDWLVRVGLPAKSGVSGGLTAASPGRFGLACYSPPLDPTGSPVRAVAALREMSGRFGMHLMHAPAPGPDTVTACTTAGQQPSGAARPPRERELLAREGSRVAVVAARGELDFTAVERVLYALASVAPDRPGWLVLDLAEVLTVRPPARAMLEAALARVTAAGHRVCVVPGGQAHGHGGLAAGAEVRGTRALAVAWAEDELLGESAGLRKSTD